jgi:hypothetical protein
VAPLDAAAIVTGVAGVGSRTPAQKAVKFSHQRVAVIRQARTAGSELLQLSAVTSAIADALRLRGVLDPAAALTTEAGIAVFNGCVSAVDH